MGNVFHRFGACALIVTCVNGLLGYPECSFHYAASLSSWVGELVIMESQDCGSDEKLSLAAKSTVPGGELLNILVRC